MLHLSTPAGETLATTTTDHPLSHYNTPVWSIFVAEPDPGPVILKNGAAGHEWSLDLLGIVDGWAVLTDKDGAALGVIWSDGPPEIGLIKHRATGSAAVGITLEDIHTGEYHVEGTVLLPGHLLGCAL